MVFTVVVSDLCDRLRLIFFGNLRQTWSEFVLADLGILRYEKVQITSASRGFGCRTEVEQYLHIHRCREDFENQTSADQILERLGALQCTNPYVRNRYDKLLFLMARQLERTGESCLALELYERSQYSGSRQRRVRISKSVDDIPKLMRSLGRRSPTRRATRSNNWSSARSTAWRANWALRHPVDANAQLKVA